MAVHPCNTAGERGSSIENVAGRFLDPKAAVGHSHTMARASEKVAVSLERDLFQRAERLRRASGESRSALVGRALRQLLREESLARDIELYVQAYERTPETDQDRRRARALARRSLSALPWEDK
jgi:hypothetical protein